MAISPKQLNQYHIFLASPGDVSVEREHVRQFFKRYNQHTAHLWNVCFEVVDWENYSTIGVGRPQELITQQTLGKFRHSLVLVIGIMGQRFGSPTGTAESGTEEEFNWALESNITTGWPEIKWFFRRVDQFTAPPDPDEAQVALEQWKKVRAFSEQLKNSDPPLFFTEYAGPMGFRDVFENDLQRWLSDSARPWVAEQASKRTTAAVPLSPPIKYYENIERDFRRLDIAGIDNERTFEIPLSEIYVRLRVMFDEDAPEETEAHESGPFDIQTALLRYPKLVIVGDPGSGKSTFLKYIALMLGRSFLTGNSTIALEKLCLPEPLPVPVFLSCWDLADFLKGKKTSHLTTLVEFVADRLAAYDFSIRSSDVERLLESGNCCLLFDGLDEVPTDRGRAAVSRLLEDCIERYGENRYVVTSRIRAYTGDTILKGQFTRCDIQPFNASDRAEFIRNWVALLFRILPDDVQTSHVEARNEFYSLTSGIEESDRIRPLAVNPLLLTVISIVHWNRKRLPEQRVDLYDECVDVLLGQRKEAEHIQLSRKMDALDEREEEQAQEERAWVRKRFAEIALHILNQDSEKEEATKADLIKLLIPRFIDKGAATDEQAAARADMFLDRQELRSGLLVSRRALSYRFVHLTFQEYLAAWHLSKMDFDRVSETIKPRLLLAKWFEALQLLGGEWARESDEKADRYIAWLLEQRGVKIASQAPVVALCANIVKDISGVAELKSKTRATFKEAVEATLDAFHKGSGIPAKTQLEILEALGQLGAAVKSHLIDATKASLYQVRRRAIEMLLPHLSDDELFSMKHILRDGSWEPIITYLRSLVDRDAARTEVFLRTSGPYTPKAKKAFCVLAKVFLDRFPFSLSVELCIEAIRVTSPAVSSTLDSMLVNWLKVVLNKHDDNKAAHRLTVELARNAISMYLRRLIIKFLADKWPNETTRNLLTERFAHDKDSGTRLVTFQALADKWPDETTRKLLTERAAQDKDSGIRSVTLQALADNWSDETTRNLLTERAVEDNNENTRIASLQTLAKKWPDENTLNLLRRRAVEESIPTKRGHVSMILGKMHSEFGQILPTEDLDGIFPYLDTRKPISRKHIEKAAKIAGIAEDQIDATIRSLSEHLGWDITKGSKTD